MDISITDIPGQQFMGYTPDWFHAIADAETVPDQPQYMKKRRSRMPTAPWEFGASLDGAN